VFKEKVMNSKNYNTELISKEIEQLLNNVGEFMAKKDLFVESIKYSYLTTSNNN
jgi:hypothetical protein